MRNQPPEYSNDVLDALTTHIAVLDAAGVIVGVNDAWRRFCERNGGHGCGHYVRSNYLEVCDRAFRATGDPAVGTMRDALRAVLSGEREQFAYEYPCNSPQEERWFILRITSCKGGGVIRAVVAHDDITERKRAEHALALADDELRRAKHALETANAELWKALAREEQSARTDELTGVANRRHFFDAASRLAEIARRYGHPLSLLVFDVDRFKGINDRHGHQTGDEVLRHVTRIALAQLRSADLFARYGGEEFVALLPETSLDDACLFAERVRRALEAEPMENGRDPIPVTVSTGVASMVAGETLEALIRRADEALYAAKEGGRNQVRRAELRSP